MEISTLQPPRVTLLLHTLLGLGLMSLGGLCLISVLSPKIWFEWVDSDPNLQELAKLQARPNKHWNLRIKSASHAHFLDLDQPQELGIFAGDELQLPSTWTRHVASGTLRAQSDEESSVLITHPHGFMRMLPSTHFSFLSSKPCLLELDFFEGALSLFLEPNKKPLCLHFKKQSYVLSNESTRGWLRVESKDQELLLFPRGLKLRQGSTTLDGEAYRCDQAKCEATKKAPSVWLPPVPKEQTSPLFIKGPYANARFISTTNSPIWVPIEVTKIPVDASLELEMIRWDDPEFEPQTVPSRHGLLVPLRNGNYRYRVRLKDSEGALSDWTPERQLSIQEYHYGGRSALPLKQEATPQAAAH